MNVDEVSNHKVAWVWRSVRVFVVGRKRDEVERGEGLYSGQDRCLAAKREWRSMNNSGQAALRVNSRIRQAVLEEAGNHAEPGGPRTSWLALNQRLISFAQIISCVT